jgi:TolB-like protein/Tfp pilus assembly protein PilF
LREQARHFAVKIGNFFGELKRRNVYKVAVAYAVIAWLLVQAASILFPTFEAPPWVMKVFVVIVAAGFVIALIIAWAFEMTPEGIKRTEDVPPDEKIPQWSRRKFAVLILVIAIAAAALLGYQVFRSNPAAPSSPHNSELPLKSIAVLPFENLSDDKANAYFAEGIQDEILTRLAKIADLKVISRTSTQRFKSAPADLKEIAKQLDVANILEGSVQRATDQVRVTVQLINATTDAHLWAETYDRKLLDTFQVESDIAQKIATTLEAKLTGKEKAAINMRGTDNPQAYETYLHAVALRDSQSDADSVRRRDLLREAVRLDPNFVEAWSWLTVLESIRYFFPEESPAQKDRARTAAETALRLSPESADAQGAMGVYYYYVEKNYDEALRWLDRARAIAPNDWKFISATALVKRRQGKLDETIALQKHGIELDPLNVENWVDLAASYRGRRDLEQTRVTLDRALAISPNDANIIAKKAETYIASGDLEKSWQMLRDLKFGAGDEGFGTLVDVMMARRDYDEALRRIAALHVSGDESPLFRALDRSVTGQIEFNRGNLTAAKPLLLAAEKDLAQLRDQHEGGIIVLEQLLHIDAYLGRREEVERLGEQLRALRRLDKWSYPLSDLTIAIGYAQMGDADRAVPLLDKVLHETYVLAITPAYLRFDLRLDPIRNDPRFQKLANL